MFCHDSIGMSGGLVLLEGQSYGNLVDVPPQNAAALARGLLRVTPDDPDNSFLLVKLIAPTSAEGLRSRRGSRRCRRTRSSSCGSGSSRGRSRRAAPAAPPCGVPRSALSV